MKISKEFNDIVNFTFSFVNGLKKLLNFFHFKWMITLLVYNRSYGYFFLKLFSNLNLKCFYYYWLYL